MLLSQHFVHFMIKEINKAEEEIDEARSSGMSDDTEYIGYREGVCDSYQEVLANLGFSNDEIEELLKRQKNNSCSNTSNKNT